MDILDLLYGNTTEEVFFDRIGTDVKTYKPYRCKTYRRCSDIKYAESTVFDGFRKFIEKAIYNIRSMPRGNTILIVIISP